VRQSQSRYSTAIDPPTLAGVSPAQAPSRQRPEDHHSRIGRADPVNTGEKGLHLNQSAVSPLALSQIFG